MWATLWMGCTGPVIDADPDPPVSMPAEAAVQFEGGAPAHLLMISIDTLRRDAFARYGGGGNLPFLDGMLEAAVTLDDHTTCSNWTFHSTTCALSGAQPMDWGFFPEYREARIAAPVPDGSELLATWMGRGGFSSTLVTTNALLSNTHNNAIGYDQVIRLPELRDTPAEVVGQEALDVLAGMADAEHRFVHLHLMEPHQPYTPPDTYLAGLDALGPIPYDLTTSEGHQLATIDYPTLTPGEQALIEAHMQLRYAGALRWLDDQLGALWTDLDAGGWLDDTLVVFWTDHGEQFWEHGYQTHAFTLYGEETDGILAFWGEDLPARDHAAPTSAIDMVPTILSAFGLDLPDQVTGQVVGLAPDDRPRFAMTVAKAGIAQWVQIGSDKLLFGWNDPTAVDEWLVAGAGIHQFDRAGDPTETTDRFDPEDPTTQRLWDALLPQIHAAQQFLPDDVAWPEGLPR